MIINKLRDNYTIIDNQIIFDRNITDKAMRLMCYFCTAKYIEQFIFDDKLIAVIRNDLGYTINEIYDCYKQLTEGGYLKIISGDCSK